MFSATMAGLKYLKTTFGNPMGNEASSVHIHSALTAEDLKALRAHFPGGGNSLEAPSALDFGQWPLWNAVERALMERTMKDERTGEITFQAFQEVAGNVVRGTCEERVKLLFRLLDRDMDKAIRASELRPFVSHILETAAKIAGSDSEGEATPMSVADSAPSAEMLADSLMHELIMPGESPKSSLHSTPKEDLYLDFDMIERWLVMKCPLFESIYLFVLAKTFGMALFSTAGTTKPTLLPTEGLLLSQCPGDESRLNLCEVMFLNNNLPVALRSKWRPIFDSRKQGESFAKMSSALLNRGPTLIIVWEKSGHKFGGFASSSWKLGPKFFGADDCFLFSLSPKLFAYEAARFNANYQYMNLKQKTMPNGIGMGGQLEFFGMWLDSEFGQGRCAPSCTSYQSPQLSKEEHFKYEHIEVWGVGEEPAADSDEEGGPSALDMDPEAQAVMEMMGKTFVSKTVKAEDEQREKEKRDEDRKDQQ